MSRLIDADALMTELMDSDLDHLQRDDWKEVIQIVADAPTITPEPYWIPCSDGLPKTNDPVNVTYVNHNPGNYYAEVKDKPYTATAHFHNGQWYWYSCTTQDLLDEYGTWIPDLIDKDVEITAWCELPEPYKGVAT